MNECRQCELYHNNKHRPPTDVERNITIVLLHRVKKRSFAQIALYFSKKTGETISPQRVFALYHQWKDLIPEEASLPL